MFRTLATLAAALSPAALTAAVDARLFDYDRSKPHDVRTVGTETRDGIEVRDITYANLAGGRTAAYLVVPRDTANRPAILFVHWYGPPHPTSNRTQYVQEAITLAKSGVISLLPATMWSDPKWFGQRKRTDDLANSIHQAKELRRALDVLLAQPGVDTRRVAFVGHDFGAMFGTILASVDGRPRFYALQAGTGRFHHWYLYGPPMPEPERSKFIESLKAIDPVEHIGSAKPVPVLFQFANKDEHVAKARAEEFIAATPFEKKVLWYDSDHGMNAASVEDRIEWLRNQLHLRASK